MARLLAPARSARNAKPTWLCAVWRAMTLRSCKRRGGDEHSPGVTSVAATMPRASSFRLPKGDKLTMQALERTLTAEERYRLYAKDSNSGAFALEASASARAAAAVIRKAVFTASAIGPKTWSTQPSLNPPVTTRKLKPCAPNWPSAYGVRA
jgi:hypothetical protein